MRVALGIITLAIGVLLMIYGTLVYVVNLDIIAEGKCGEDKVKSQYSTGRATVTEYYPQCQDPNQGFVMFGGGLGALIGGVVIIVKSRKQVVSKA